MRRQFAAAWGVASHRLRPSNARTAALPQATIKSLHRFDANCAGEPEKAGLTGAATSLKPFETQRL